MSDDKRKIGYAWQIGAVTDDGINIGVTGNFEIGTPDSVINAELDRFINIFSRQRARTVLAKEEDQLKKDRATLESLREQVNKAAEVNSAKTADKMAVEQLKKNVEHLQTTIVMREQGIATLKQLIDPAP